MCFCVVEVTGRFSLLSFMFISFSLTGIVIYFFDVFLWSILEVHCSGNRYSAYLRYVKEVTFVFCGIRSNLTSRKEGVTSSTKSNRFFFLWPA